MWRTGCNRGFLCVLFWLSEVPVHLVEEANSSSTGIQSAPRGCSAWCLRVGWKNMLVHFGVAKYILRGVKADVTGYSAELACDADCVSDATNTHTGRYAWHHGW